MTTRRTKTLSARLFLTKDGDKVMGQSPNLVIILAVVTAVMAFPTSGLFRSFFALISFGCFFTWSWQELIEGVNLYRRIIGGATLALIVAVALFASATIHIF